MTTGRTVQAGIYREGVFGRRPVVPTSPVRPRARGPAADEPPRVRLRRRVAPARSAPPGPTSTAFDRWQVVPRMLRDVSSAGRSASTCSADRLPAPLLLAPIGVLEMAHHEADLAVGAGGRARSGLPMILSSQASRADGGRRRRAWATAPRWFQLYWSSDDDLAESFVDRAEAVGARAPSSSRSTRTCSAGAPATSTSATCRSRTAWASRSTPPTRSSAELVRAAGGRRRAGASGRRRDRPRPPSARWCRWPGTTPAGRLRASLRSPLPRAAVETFLDVFSRPSLTWDDLAWLRERTSLPIVLKGIQHPDDAARALDAGVDGIVVSNHGGRQVDGAVASLDALPGVVERVDGRVPVLFDSGVRCGADVVRGAGAGRHGGLRRPTVGLRARARRRPRRPHGAAARLGRARADDGPGGCASLAEVDRRAVTPAGRDRAP